MVNTQPVIEEANFDICSTKTPKENSCKKFHKKPILLNFVNLSIIFCPRLWPQIHWLKIVKVSTRNFVFVYKFFKNINEPVFAMHNIAKNFILLGKKF